MGYLVLIAGVLIILFGFEVALDILGWVFVGAMVLVLIGSVIGIICGIIDLVRGPAGFRAKALGAVLKWAAVAWLFWWLLSLCF